ncbi:MAG: mandelate racemase/muconate lactonizing enzyme family protein [Desulfobacterales bacterium]|nr:MAG: mandelate racemase/muconate lactonizing enzyme family protein [Desulfobacterales bacterium]
MTKPIKIKDVKAYPSSCPLSADSAVTLGIGRTVKRDAVIIKVVTEDGLIGFGESHHGRCPGAVAHLVNTTLRQLVVEMDAFDVVGVWNRIYRMQLSSHGMGTAAAIAMSGIDMALWDIRGKAVGWPLYRLFGGSARPIAAYAGGVSLGYQEPAMLVDEVSTLLEAGYRAVKLRVGDSAVRDLERVAAVRKTFGADLTILVDANTGYTIEDVRHVIPEFESYGVGWLEEPFPDHDRRSYALAATFGTLPLAAGENRYTRFEFSNLIEEGIIQILQPDLSKTGGPTEAMRIAAMASAHKLPIHPHTSITGLNMAATIHFLAAIDNRGYFEADVSKNNLFRDELVSEPYALDAEGCVHPINKPGIGVEVDEEFLAKHPVIEGPAYV